jgi:hypothetical protein
VNLVKNEHVELVLETLSFFEPMTLESIIMDFDKAKVEKLKEFTKDDLEVVLKHLIKKKKVKKIMINKNPCWIKMQPKKSTLKKLLSFLKK